jgi:hypothetical protein
MKKVKLANFLSDLSIKVFQIILATLVIGTLVKYGPGWINIVAGAILCLISLTIGIALYIIFLIWEEQERGKS